MSSLDASDSAEPPFSRRFVSLLVVGLLGALMRLLWLDGVPPGINQDEAIHAYDAYCLLKTGMDHAGVRWPIFVHANGVLESHSAPFVYLLIPFQALLGMNVWSTRLPAALLGSLTVLLTYSLVRRWYGHRAALLASLFLAISPWHIHLSRLAFEVSICPFLFVLGGWLFVRSVTPAPDAPFESRIGRLFGLGLSGLTLGITLWTYNAMRVFVPMILLAGVAIYGGKIIAFARRPRGRAAIALFVFGFGIGVAPFLWACIKTPDHAWGHARANFILHQTATLGEAMVSIVETYAMQIGPSFLFLHGDPSIVQCVPGHGELYLFDALLLLLGIVRLIRRRRDEPISLFLLVWLLLAPIPAAITKLESGHALRTAAALPAYQIVSALGFDFLLGVARCKSRVRWKGVIAVGASIIALSFARFAFLFFHAYPRLAADVFHEVYRPVVQEIQNRQSEYDYVILSSNMGGETGIYFLFWSRMPPDQYLDAPPNIVAGPDNDMIIQVGKFIFKPATALSELRAALPPDSSPIRVLVAELAADAPPTRPIFQFLSRDGRPLVGLYDVRLRPAR